jgi:hypothetical protein
MLHSPYEYWSSHWIFTSVVFVATHHGWPAVTDYMICLRSKWKDGRIDFTKLFASSSFCKGHVKKALHWTSYRASLGDMNAHGSSEDEDDFSGDEGDYSGADSSNDGGSNDLTVHQSPPPSLIT